jgi:hypothetical protein
MATQFQVTFDSAGPDKLADFWAAALSYIKQPPPEGYADWPTFLKAQGIEVDVDDASAIVDPSGVGPRVYFQKVPQPKTAKNRMHLDLNVSDIRRVGQEEGADASIRKHNVWSDWARPKSVWPTSVGSTGPSWPIPKATSSAYSKTHRPRLV